MRVASECVCCGSRQLVPNQAVLAPFVAARVFGWSPAEITDDWGLRQIRKGWSYSVCNSFTCQSCGHVFLDMRFDDDEMGRLYHGYRGQAYTDLREEFEPGYRERNQGLVVEDEFLGIVEEFLRPVVPAEPRILDWGGDTGLNTPFKGSAKVHHIYDISAKPPIAGAVQVTREQVAGQSYDLIVCSNVLEHLSYPVDALKELRSLASSDANIYIEVPYEGLMFDRAQVADGGPLKRLWHEHINFYSEQSLTELIRRSGLSIVKLSVLEYARADKFWRAFAVVARRA